MVLVNKVLAAGRAKPGQAEVMRRGALYATATLSLGLEAIARGDLGARAAGAALDRARAAVPRRLHGHAPSSRASRRRSRRARSPPGSPAKELVAALCSPRPLFARAADEPPVTGLRPFESQADLRRAGEMLAGLTLRIALVEGLGVDVVAMGQAPEPRPELDDHIRTALARAVVGGELRGEALSQAELTRLRDRGFEAGELTAAARAAGRDGDPRAPRRRAAPGLGARARAGWSTAGSPISRRILGGVKDAEIDPRFVEGVLVEVRRS